MIEDGDGSTIDVKTEVTSLVDLIRSTLMMATTTGTPAFNLPVTPNAQATVGQTLQRHADLCSGIFERMKRGIAQLERQASEPAEVLSESQIAELTTRRDELRAQVLKENTALKVVIDTVRTILLTMENWELAGVAE